MKRLAILVTLMSASLLRADYTLDLERFLSSNSFQINGKFYAYDFNKNGRIDANDWVYVTTTTHQAYRLLALTPTPDNAFGFAPVAIPAGLSLDTPTGYFVYVNFPADTDRKFSWVYIPNNTHNVYKLMGATPQHTFRYLDINNDGTYDPLPHLHTSITGTTVQFIADNLPGLDLEQSSQSSTSSYEYESSYSSSSSSSLSSSSSNMSSSDSSSISSYSSYSSSSYSTPPSSSYSYSSVSPDAAVADVITRNGYTLLAWNDLGMHCMDSDYSVFSILPPYNTLDAHLLRRGSEPKKITSGVTVTYEAYPSLYSKLNTTANGKTNFWQYVKPLYGVNLAVNTGLTGTLAPSSTPHNLTYNTTHKWWTAEGIPVTPFNDDMSYDPYQLVKVTAKDSQGNVLAQTITVLPVSTEMDCRACHGSNSGYNSAKPADGWVNLPNPERDYRFNILRLHDQKHPNAVANHIDRLQTKGYNYLIEGLEATANAGTPVLCASCHKSNALPGTGISGIPPLTQAIHSRHANVKDPQTGTLLNDIQNKNSCYMCHPGQSTQCLRGAMGKNGINCQDCHGTMSAVGSSFREGWLDEPNCQSCHQNGMRYQQAVTNKLTGTLRDAVDRRFATNSNVPMPGKSLYRYSKGHGGLTCSACHGSTHAIYPSSHAQDNIQSIGIQGHAGTIAECTSCHTSIPRTANKGPHGMHGIGDWWVHEHGDYAEHNAASCTACHGQNYRGSDLSKTFTTRTFNTEFGTKTFAKGHRVSCYDCHNGPNGGEED